MLGFQKFFSPVLIQIVYILGLIAIALITIFLLVNANNLPVTTPGGYGGYNVQYVSAGANPLFYVLVLIGAAIWAILWRVLCEAWIVIFSINDKLGQLVQRGNP